jgi:hypothetical protein
MRRATLVAAALTAVVATGAGPAAPVPAYLKALESSAEDLVDAALARDRPEVTATAQRLRGQAGSAATSLARAGVPRATIVRVEERAKAVARVAPRGSFVGVALAANAVSGVMPELYARFRDRVPPSVLTLDYLDREAQLRALTGDRNRVADAVAGLASTWARLRQKVIAAGGATPAAAYSRHVAAMKRLLHGRLKNVGNEAVRGLALVDELETVFAV